MTISPDTPATLRPTDADRALARLVVITVLKDQEAAWEPVCNMIAEVRAADRERCEALVASIDKALACFQQMPEASPHHDRKDSTWSLWTDGCNILRDARTLLTRRAG